MKSIFHPAAYQEIKERLGKLRPDTPAQWGKMGVAQMLAHCAIPIEVQLGERELEEKPFFLIRWLFKKSLYSDRPWPKGVPTARAFVIKEAKEFAPQHARLLALLDKAHTRGEGSPWRPHPAFGQYTPKQVGMAFYKHLDHHLRQFGV